MGRKELNQEIEKLEFLLAKYSKHQINNPLDENLKLYMELQRQRTLHDDFSKMGKDFLPKENESYYWIELTDKKVQGQMLTCQLPEFDHEILGRVKYEKGLYLLDHDSFFSFRANTHPEYGHP